ncbi:MAG TPA: phosphodiester glycosidase family protein [Abditibacteriaceae bacterium]|jgi:exopolysaccharide biosynthesis protein
MKCYNDKLVSRRHADSQRSYALFLLLLTLPMFPLLPARSQSTAGSAAPVTLRAGEIRVDGRVSSVDVRQGRFLLDVSSFTTPRGRSRMTLPVKHKQVSVDSGTRFHHAANQRQRVSMAALRVGMAVAVIGRDLGDGRILPARFILVDTVAAERAKTVIAGKTPDIRSSGFRVQVNGRSYAGTQVQVHLDTVRVKVGLGRNQVGLTEALASMARRHGALAAINGSYFQAYNPGQHKPPVMTLITNGQPVFTGNIGTTMGFTAQNEVRMDRATIVLKALSNPSNGYAYNYGVPTGGSTEVTEFWSRVQEGLGCGPRLVTDGRISLDLRGEKFADPKVLVLSTARSAVGVTRDRRLLLVTTSGTVAQLAGIMKALGAYQAMNLDGGASSGLWLRERYLRSPGRNLSNCLLILPR